MFCIPPKAPPPPAPAPPPPPPIPAIICLINSGFLCISCIIAWVWCVGAWGGGGGITISTGICKIGTKRGDCLELTLQFHLPQTSLEVLDLPAAVVGRSLTVPSVPPLLPETDLYYLSWLMRMSLSSGGLTRLSRTGPKGSAEERCLLYPVEQLDQDWAELEK